MNTEKLIVLSAAVISSITAAANIYFSAKTARASRLAVAAARQAQRISAGQAEANLQSSIRSSRSALRDIQVRITDFLDGKNPNKLTASRKRKLDGYLVAAEEAIESNLNCYEDACAKYIDNKTDRGRFKKTYVEDIRALCRSEDPLIQNHLHPEVKSHFQAIWKVYREWHIHEK